MSLVIDSVLLIALFHCDDHFWATAGMLVLALLSYLQCTGLRPVLASMKMFRILKRGAEFEDEPLCDICNRGE
jgi:hypothetical protein